jgi:hypothetical protein
MKDNMSKKFPCPCCGYLTLNEGPGQYDVCPICYWEDDLSQLRFPTMGGGANKPSLLEAQIKFAETGAIEERFLPHVRKPNSGDIRDVDWRPLNTQIDHIEVPERGRDYGTTYNDDLTIYYYWRR